ncbi:MAG: HAD-IIA family hydrolase [Planctomycetales bacterium]|nr:HAD-IIA family hydrolase [Planctomycetales bacterium]
MNSAAIEAQLAEIKHLALDMDGTIYLGGTLFDFTPDFLKWLREMGIGYTFLTNNSSKSAADYLAHLREMNLQVHSDQLYTSGMATIDYLRTRHPEFRHLFLLGTESLCDEFRQAGFSIVCQSSEAEPDAVVVAFDSELVYSRLCLAGYWIEQGKPYIATHPDLVCPTDQRTLLVDCGSICACLEKATGRAPDVVLGKPHPLMLEAIMRRFDLEPRHLAMIGDRLSTDMAMAKNAAAMGILVLTGEATVADLEDCPAPPDLVAADLSEVGRRLSLARSRAV